MAAPPGAWKFFHFGLLVTGRGEEGFLQRLFRSLMERGNCHFEVIRKVEQLSPRTSAKPRLKPTGAKPLLTERDEEIALCVRRHLQAGYDYVVLVDDLEGARRQEAAAVYGRYRTSFDAMLPPALRCRASVHFLVNMLEAYYFADANAINVVLGTDLSDHDGDVETIGHPKSQLKALGPFDEIEHGEQIMRLLDVPHVLSRPETCSSLRTLFGWCWRALGLPPGEDYQLANGCYFDVTRPQIDDLPPVDG
jgi:hypothetical protein